MTRRERQRVRLAWGMALCAILLAGSTREEPRPPELCLTALDVGQGDALLLEPPEGLPWLVDGGGAPGSRYDVGLMRVVPALRARGIDRLGLVVMTHGDEDHAGGLFAVMEQLTVEGLLVPRRTRLGTTERALHRLAAERGVPLLVADEGPALPLLGGGAAARLLHPGSHARSLSANDASVVVSARLGAVPMLLTGDIEEIGEHELLESRAPLRAAVLKVAHHGSRTSSSSAFLDAVAPLVAVAGLGDGNRFGFPHHAVTARLRERGTPFFSTAESGEVRVCTDGFALRVERGAHGRWEEALRIEADVVAAWALGPERLRGGGPPQEGTGTPQTGRRREGTSRSRASGSRAAAKRAKAKSRKANASRAKPRSTRGKGKARSSGEATEEEVPPTLLPDREWSRSRRDRGRPRPPWRSRR